MGGASPAPRRSLNLAEYRYSTVTRSVVIDCTLQEFSYALGVYALIGDLVGSRRLPDRAAAQRRVGEVLRETTELLAGSQPLEQTFADEFQGGYLTLEAATRAGLLVRLALLPDGIDVRCGIGLGETIVYDDSRSPLVQDGPAWWSARAALEQMGAPRRSAVRTWFSGPDPARAAAANAHLLCRDALVDRLSERGWRMLRLALLGESQRRIAESEGITKSAVSQQFARGIGAVRDAQELLKETR